MMNERHHYVIGVLIGDVSYDFTTELMSGISETGTKEQVQLQYLLGAQRRSSLPDGSPHPAKTLKNHNGVY
ncbi:MAG: hypothetical protein PHO41_09840, partial [Eubacteriales bacterium]|nr:hypothetical protein [Eubacteriales bacterium]